MAPELPIYFYLLLPVVAILYSSVGHGGASGYLALMALFGAPVSHMKPVALVLNLFVAGISFFMFRKNGYFNWKLIYPFIITSVPAAFIGGFMQLNSSAYKIILALFMFFSVIKLMGWIGKGIERNRESSILLSMVIGLLIGLASGLIGIGGGIILSPIILLLGWADMKETAAASALFIWVNSLAGLLGHLTGGASIPADIWIFVLAVLLGAILGAHLGSKLISNHQLQKLLALVLFLAGIKLLMI